MRQDFHGRIGQTLAGRYRVEGILGRGGMGIVSEVTHLRLGRRFALKTLRADASFEAESVERFRREAQVTARLGHPHIVEVVDFDTSEDGEPFVVMELLVGETLGARLAAGPLDVLGAVAIGYQVAKALGAAHASGVVHRDLKPDNVFLCSNGSWPDFVKVLDFGMSKIRDSVSLRTQSAVLLGTPRYMSPEQATGKASECDARTDVFALGVMLWEALTGRPAFDAAHIPGVLQAVCSVELAPLSTLVPDVPQALSTVIARATSKAPGDRFQDVTEFGRALVDSLPAEAQRALGARRNLLSQPSRAPAAASVDLGRTLPSSPMGRRRIRGGLAWLGAGALLVSAVAWTALHRSGPWAEAPAPSEVAVPVEAAPTPTPALAPAPAPTSTTVPTVQPSAEPAPPRPRSATLIVSSKLLSKVYLDGRMVDETPARLSGLAPGSHVVRVVGSLDTSCERTQTVHLLEGELRRLTVDCSEPR